MVRDNSRQIFARSMHANVNFDRRTRNQNRPAGCAEADLPSRTLAIKLSSFLVVSGEIEGWHGARTARRSPVGLQLEASESKGGASTIFLPLSEDKRE